MASSPSRTFSRSLNSELFATQWESSFRRDAETGTRDARTPQNRPANSFTGAAAVMVVASV
jgi:hypothetical protein